jgi:large subunit ribosomal protein L15
MSLKLWNLTPGDGARTSKKRLGRGEGSGLGKTSGKGGKGQTARTGGKVKRHFEGGQMPLYRRVPKVGFTSRKRLVRGAWDQITGRDLSTFEEGTTITPELLVASGLVRSGCRVKAIGGEGLVKKLVLRVHGASAGLKSKVEELGGSLEILAPQTAE